MSQVEVARQEWEEGSRRLEAAREDGRRYRQLLELLDLVLDELRKRLGQTYTLAELVAAYGESERWAREVLEERATLAGLAARSHARPRRRIRRVSARRYRLQTMKCAPRFRSRCKKSEFWSNSTHGL